MAEAEDDGGTIQARNKQGIQEELRQTDVQIQDHFHTVYAMMAARGQASSMLGEIQQRQQQQQQQLNFTEMVATMEEKGSLNLLARHNLRHSSTAGRRFAQPFGFFPVW